MIHWFNWWNNSRECITKNPQLVFFCFFVIFNIAVFLDFLIMIPSLFYEFQSRKSLKFQIKWFFWKCPIFYHFWAIFVWKLTLFRIQTTCNFVNHVNSGNRLDIIKLKPMLLKKMALFKQIWLSLGLKSKFRMRNTLFLVEMTPNRLG